MKFQLLYLNSAVTLLFTTSKTIANNQNEVILNIPVVINNKR